MTATACRRSCSGNATSSARRSASTFSVPWKTRSRYTATPTCSRSCRRMRTSAWSRPKRRPPARRPSSATAAASRSSCATAARLSSPTARRRCRTRLRGSSPTKPARVARPRRPRGGAGASWTKRRAAAGRDLRAGRVTGPGVVTQDPRFGGGAYAQTEAFVRAARELGRTPDSCTRDSSRSSTPSAQLARVAPARARRRAARSALGGRGRSAARRGRAPVGPALRRLDRHGAGRGVGRAKGVPAPLAATRARPQRAAPAPPRAPRAAGRAALYATSASSRAASPQRGASRRTRWGSLPIPVDLEIFQPAPRKERENMVVFVGRADDPRKNARLLLEAWPLVRSELPEATLRLVGRPPRRPAPGRRRGCRRGRVRRRGAARERAARPPVAPGGLRDRRRGGARLRNRGARDAVRGPGGARPRLRRRHRPLRLRAGHAGRRCGRGPRRPGAARRPGRRAAAPTSRRTTTPTRFRAQLAAAFAEPDMADVAVVIGNYRGERSSRLPREPRRHRRRPRSR